MALTSAQVQDLAHACGFEIAGVTAAEPQADFQRFHTWAQSARSADLGYLQDHRCGMRADPQLLLPTAQSIICLGKVYNTDRPLSVETDRATQGWISRYAWGFDYHDVLRPPLEALIQELTRVTGQEFDSKICIDTVPLLERSYARAAGLGWIGRNTCLINQEYGSWFFLAELLVSLAITPDTPVADRCGTCTRCIQACPTDAIVPNSAGGFDLDAGLCISYLTIEKRGAIDSALSAVQGNHIFGCDICQDVCPWNQRALLRSGFTDDPAFASRIFAPDLAQLAGLQEDEFGRLFRHTPVWRTKYSGFLRNVAIAMGNSGSKAMREPLLRLTSHSNQMVSEAATSSLSRLESLLAG